MAKKISLSLEIGGVKQNISSINELEKAIRGAKEQLKGVEIGSKEFEDLSNQIRKAQNYAEDLNESLKPQELEKRVGAYAKVGSAIVSSFAAAQSAISLFGAESEDVAKAAAKAQAILTIALTAREIAEGAVALKTVASNIATYASAKAATAANVATRAFYTTLASNPFTAIAIAIGAVVTAYIAYTSSTDEATTETKKLVDVLSEETVNLQNQADILKDVNTKSDLRVQTIKELKKEYPGFNAFLDEENNLNADGVRFLDLKIKQMLIEARIKQTITNLTEAQNRQIELTNKDVLSNLTLLQKLNPLTSKYGEYVAQWEQDLKKGNKEIENNTNLLNQQKEEQAKVNAELAVLDEKREQQIKQEGNASDALKRSIEQEKIRKKAFEDGKNSIIDFTLSLKILTQELESYNRIIERLNALEVDTTTLEETRAVIEKRKKLLEDEIPLTQKISSQLKEISTISIDPILNGFREFRSELETIFLDVLEGKKSIGDFNKAYTDFLTKNPTLTQKQTKVVLTFTDAWRELTDFFQKNPIFKQVGLDLAKLDVAWDDNLTNTENLAKQYKGLLNILGELSANAGDFTKEFDDANKLIEEFKFDPIKARENVDKVFKEIEKGLFNKLAKKFAELRKQEIELKLGEGILDPKTLGELQGELSRITDILKKDFLTPELFKSEEVDKIKGGVKSITDEMLKFLGTLDRAEGRYLGVVEQVQRLNKELGDNASQLSKATGKILFENAQQISKTIFGLKSKQERDDQSFREKARKELEKDSNFQTILRVRGLTQNIKNNEDLLDLYVEYLKERNQLQKQYDDEAEKQRVERLEKISSGIGEFANVLLNVEDLINQSFQNQLQALQQTTDAQLSLVVGDTETAAKKRLEIEQQYQEQKKLIEKKATVSSLKFQLAQAVASSAQAILSIYAVTGFNPIIAGIQTALIAGITAAQISIINEQINLANMMRRGGLVKAQGGMLLSGPTHEQGGIPLAQMGVIAEGQEAIINRNSLINYRDLLSTVNQSGGGRPLVVNNFDDSRIVEAIAEQRQKPLRAYVLQSEITNEQALSKRLDDLSKI